MATWPAFAQRSATGQLTIRTNGDIEVYFPGGPDVPRLDGRVPAVVRHGSVRCG
jgi:hypothetical protein